MITKVCQFSAQQQGERLVEVFQPGYVDRAAEFFMGKTAAPMLPEVQQYLEDLRPNPQKIYVLVNALGAGEFWGSNINGDYFPEAALIHKGHVYGYETFYQAYPYKHHVNKDPSKAFGRVELSVWHDEMKRCELVIAIDRISADKFGATDVCDKLDHGQFPDVSMGCKVPYDICSVCTNWPEYARAQATFDPVVHRSPGQAVLHYHKARPIRGISVTRNDYCEHLRTMLNKILGDGKKVYAVNDYPRFFDISFVFIGADKTAKVMAKLASIGYDSDTTVPSWFIAEQMGYDQPAIDKGFEKTAFISGARIAGMASRLARVQFDKAKPKKRRKGKRKHASVSSVRDLLREKKASQAKAAEITKEITPQFGGKAIPVEPDRPDLPNDVLDTLGKSDLSSALSTPSALGMILKPREFQRITIIGLGKKPLADQMDRDGLVFPPSRERDESVPLGMGHFSHMLKKLLMPHMEGRSMLEPMARRRVIKITISGGLGGDDIQSPQDAEESPFLQKIGAAYNGYLNNFTDCFQGVDDLVSRDPELWEVVHRAGLAEGFEKTSAGVNVAAVLGAIGGAWGISQVSRHQRRRATMGARAPTGVLTDLLADNPNALMALAGLGALHATGAKLPGQIVKAVGNVAQQGLKHLG